MNKYEKSMIESVDRRDKENYKILKELVDRATPQKPEISGDGLSDGKIVYDTWYCPGRNQEFEIDYDMHDFCPRCGQAIDNSDLDSMR